MSIVRRLFSVQTYLVLCLLIFSLVIWWVWLIQKPLQGRASFRAQAIYYFMKAGLPASPVSARKRYLAVSQALWRGETTYSYEGAMPAAPLGH